MYSPEVKDNIAEPFEIETMKCGDLRNATLPGQDCLTIENRTKSHENLNCGLEKKGSLFYHNMNGLQRHEMNGPVENGEVKCVDKDPGRQNSAEDAPIEMIPSSTELRKSHFTQKNEDINGEENSRTDDFTCLRTQTNQPVQGLEPTQVTHEVVLNNMTHENVSNMSTPSRTNNVNKDVASLVDQLSDVTVCDLDSSKLPISFVGYKSEAQMPEIMSLITQDLSEPYSVYTYRYFLHNWPNLSHLAYFEGQCIGAVVCKLDLHQKNVWRGYIAMLVIHKDFRKQKIGSNLVKLAIKKMTEQGCDEVVLETEVTNRAALGLYENLGFIRDKRLLRYYLNGVDAWRLKLWLR